MKLKIFLISWVLLILSSIVISQDLSLTTLVDINNTLDKEFKPNLVKIDQKYICKSLKDKDLSLDYRVIKDLYNFLDFSISNGQNVCIKSSYRSYYEQECAFYWKSKKVWCVKNSKRATAIMPWASEHQLWLAVDLEWKYDFLDKYMYKYGFIKTYNKNDLYDLGNGNKAPAEEWHYRYIWVENIDLFTKYGSTDNPQDFFKNFEKYKKLFQSNIENLTWTISVINNNKSINNIDPKIIILLDNKIASLSTDFQKKQFLDKFNSWINQIITNSSIKYSTKIKLIFIKSYVIKNISYTDKK